MMPLRERFAGEHLLRELAPQVLAAVVRRYGDFAAAEDAVQEALVAAAAQWPQQGVPDNPRGWLIHVAARRMTDHVRAELARRRRELVVMVQASEEPAAPAPDADNPPEQDDTLALLFMCCHPALTRPSAIALTLRAVGGLTTAEIASAFLVPEATMAQRISRAKQSIKSSGVGFELPDPAAREQRLDAVLHVLYLIFNEALRLTRAVHALLPEDSEVAGLLALMLLTDARRPARSDADGELIPLAEQDRSLWDRAMIVEGTALVTQAFTRGPLGAYQLQAAIASLHDEAVRAEDTDWRQIMMLYRVLMSLGDNPMVALNHAVAAAMVHGPAKGLELIAALERDDRIAQHHRLAAVRAHLLEMAGQSAEAIACYRDAAARTNSTPERNYLLTKAAQLARGEKD